MVPIYVERQSDDGECIETTTEGDKCLALWAAPLNWKPEVGS